MPGVLSAFTLLNPLIQGVLIDLGFVAPTEPQELAIPRILSGEHLLLIAPTGSGKTESAVLPLFHRVLDKSSDERAGISVLYITPLRALNRDMLSRLERLGELIGITVGVRHGDTSKSERQRQSLHPPDVLITTPETLQIMLTGKRLRANLASVSHVVVDEVHELAASKRGSQLSIALERLVEVCGEFQRIGLSATVGNPLEVACFLGGFSEAGVGRNVDILEVDVVRKLDFNVIYPTPTIEDREAARRLNCTPELACHVRIIKVIVGGKRSTLIFVNTREAAEALGSRFKMLGESVGVHHGSLSRHARIEAEEDFKAGKLKALICTSSMELGIDIGDIDHVIQYMSPREVSRLIQRVGRSGHSMDRISSGTIITTSEDDAAESWSIIENATKGEIEEIKLHKSPTDVIANQISALTLEYREITPKKAYDIMRRAYPFHDLEFDQFEEVAVQTKDNRLVWIDEEDGKIRRRRKSFQYFYENISMIHDEKKYEVHDIVSRRSIGALDEVFIANFARLGAVFIAKGEMWRIIEVLHEKQRVNVEPLKDPGGEIPNWVGEEIPVPFRIAQETGAIRQRIADQLKNKTDPIPQILEAYNTTGEAAEKVSKLIHRQLIEELPVPTDKTITIEANKDEITINLCAGHRVNETLGHVLTSLLTTRMGASVAMEIDPYRIRLTVPKRIPARLIQRMILELKPEYVEPIIEIMLKNTTLLKWKIVHIARKYGALSLNIDYEQISMQKLLSIFEDTPMYHEAIREILHDRLDTPRTEEVIKKIHSDEITVTTSRPSPIGEAGFTGGRNLVSPQRADATILKALRERIMEDRIILFCAHCKEWRSHRKVKNVPEIPQCPLCDSRMIAALKPWEEEEIKIIRKRDRNREEEERAKRVYKNSHIVLSHGKQAVIALASRGIGPETASKVIGKLRANEEDFYRDILEAERNYARTKQFWNLPAK